ncbi:MarR family winged helix-turn-helix transcriptional regulator [Peribacillus frigoritolerans]|uniref:MarR family winged helix-turn-helix transcriptional regulator n=1 Tax=Peribacillus frigoritolerans TaxID=450367 RepID=UPI0010593D25|nr:MarR family transcriptional regulator [Peribacillus frigoritolerans]TDL82933.1 MarR family transcriptional regulator [Peribacillus frigoritolerans]
METRQELTYEFLSNYRKLNKMTRTHLNELLDTYLPFNEFMVLRLIHEQKHINISQIAEKLSVSASHITSVSEKLIKKGYLTRIRALDDRRVVYLELTETGEKVKTEVETTITEYFHQKLENVTNEEIIVFNRLLTKLLEEQ